MAVWTDIANTQVEADAPITTDLMQALRDNVTAQAEGASGAPKNQLASMDTDSVGTSQIIDANVTRPKINIKSRSTSVTAKPSTTTYYELPDDCVFMPVSVTTGSQYVTCDFVYVKSYGKHVVVLVNTDAQSRPATVAYNYL